MADFKMPQLGAGMEAGTLVEWLVKPGDAVHRGDIVAVVETEKGAIEIEIFEDGVVEKLLVDPDSRVPVGTILATVRSEDETPADAAVPALAAAASKSPPEKVPPVKTPTKALPRGESGQGRVKISPAAARLAAERGIDISRIAGTGPQGAIRIADLEGARAKLGTAMKPLAEGRTSSPAEGMRRAIGAAMSQSKREIPHYYVATTIDFQVCTDWLATTNAERPVTERLLYGALLIKAVALALRRYPEFNGFWRETGFEAGAGIHVGAAVALRGGGLVAPAIHDADGHSVDDLMAALRDLVARARASRLRSSEMTDPTVTVTSLGEQGVEDVLGVIYPPQVALIGFGRPAMRPWVTGSGAVDARSVIRASLSADHRASDGHRGALLLNEIDRLLQEPGKL